LIGELFQLPKYPAIFLDISPLLYYSSVYNSFLRISSIPAAGKRISLTFALCFVDSTVFDPCIWVVIAESVLIEINSPVYFQSTVFIAVQ
jgi:hypothetical protein